MVDEGMPIDKELLAMVVCAIQKPKHAADVRNLVFQNDVGLDVGYELP